MVGLTLNVDTAATAFKKDGPLVDFLAGAVRLSRDQILNKSYGPEDQRALAKACRGVRVSLPTAPKTTNGVWKCLLVLNAEWLRPCCCCASVGALMQPYFIS